MWIEVLAKNYASVIGDIEAALRDCPSGLWETSIWPVRKTDNFVWPVKRAGGKRPGKAEQERLLQVHSEFWNVAYHAIFHTDLYLSRGELKGFAPLRPFLEKDHHGNTVPIRTYTRRELLKYVAHIRKKSERTFASLTDEIANEPVAKRIGGGSFGELLVGNLGHMQEHVAQMSLFLSQHLVERKAGAAGLTRLPQGVKGRDDAGLDEFVKSLGGYEQVIETFFRTWVPNLAPISPAVVRFEVGKGWTVKGIKGRAIVANESDIDLSVRVSGPNFIRWIAGELDFDKAEQDGRIVLDGDADALRRLSPARK